MAAFSTLRAWARTPRWTIAVLLCLAVSIAGAGTVLTFAYSLLARPLPFPEGERLAIVEPLGLAASERAYLSYPNFADLRERLRSFERLEGAMVSRLVVETPQGTERLRGETVTPGYFDLLALRPLLGRAFAADEYAGGAAHVVLLSTRVFRSHFGGDPSVVGRTLVTRAGPRTVVGIMPEGFLGIAEGEGTDVWVPERQSNHPQLLTDRAERTVLSFGRLAAGTTPERASAELSGAVATLSAEHPEANRALQARVVPLGDYWRSGLREGVAWLLLGSLFLLAIGCGNVALLLLARLVPLEREMALRLSLGASRGRIVRERLAEAALLSGAGGALGIAGALALIELFEEAGRFALPIHLKVDLDLAPLALCAAVVVLAGVVSGVVPALVAGRASASFALRPGSRGVVASALGGRLGPGLVAAQTALAFAVLVGAALFARSYDQLRFVDFGYRTSGVLRYQVSLPASQAPTPEALSAFWNGLEADLAALPGVRGTGYMRPTLPPYDAEATRVSLRGEAVAAPADALQANLRWANTGAFSALGIALSEGRFFAAHDRRGTPPVALVSESLARRLGGIALGRTLLIAAEPQVEAEIVGVVEDARWNGQRDRSPSGNDVFLSLAQFPHASVGVVFEVAGAPRNLVEPVRRLVLQRAPGAALHWITTMDEALDAQTAVERFWALLAGAYGLAAFLLSVVGLYGVLSYAVSSRVREIGLRMAIGASPAAVRWMTVAQGLRAVLAGVAAGALLGFAAGRVAESKLHGVAPFDLPSYAAAAGLVLATSLLTSLLPAWRASRTDPMAALRQE
jgi:predicted permease